MSDDAHVNIDDDDGVDIDKLLDVNSTICIEKEIAADTIGTIFAATRQHFLPYVEQCTIELVGLLPHYYDGIRKAATESLLEIIRSFYEIRAPAEWQPGQAVPVPLDQQVKDLIEHILPPMFEMYETEDNKYVSFLCRPSVLPLLASAPCDERFNSAHFDAQRARETLI